MTNAKKLGLEKVSLILDRVFVTEDNFNYLYQNSYGFVTSLAADRAEARKLVDANNAEVRKSANRIAKYEVYGLKRPVMLYGRSLFAHIYFDADKQAFDEKAVYARIERLQAELEEMGRPRRVAKRFSDYFVVDTLALGEEVSYVLDGALVDVWLGRCGFFILLSSDSALSSEEVLELYRERDVVEKGFCGFKGGLDFRRVRAHWGRTLEGKVFVGFLALILRSHVCRVLHSCAETRHLTFEKVLLELEKIRIVTLLDLTQINTSLTKLQKVILKTLNVPIETLSTKPT